MTAPIYNPTVVDGELLADNLMEQYSVKAAFGHAIKAMDDCVIDEAWVRPPFYLAAVTIHTARGDQKDPHLDAGLRPLAAYGGFGTFTETARVLLVDAALVDDLACTECLDWNPAGSSRRTNRPVIVAGAVAFFPWRPLADMAADLHTALERAKTDRLPGQGAVHVHISDGEVAAMGLDHYAEPIRHTEPLYVPAAA